MERSGRKGESKREKDGGRERERASESGREIEKDKKDSTYVRPTSVESDETLLDSAPGISRGNGGLILRRKFLTSRTFEPGREGSV